MIGVPLCQVWGNTFALNRQKGGAMKKILLVVAVMMLMTIGLTGCESSSPAHDHSTHQH